MKKLLLNKIICERLTIFLIIVSLSPCEKVPPTKSKKQFFMMESSTIASRLVHNEGQQYVMFVFKFRSSIKYVLSEFEQMTSIAKYPCDFRRGANSSFPQNNCPRAQMAWQYV